MPAPGDAMFTNTMCLPASLTWDGNVAAKTFSLANSARFLAVLPRGMTGSNNNFGITSYFNSQS